MKIYIVVCHDGNMDEDRVEVFTNKDDAIEECREMSRMLCRRYTNKEYEAHDIEEEGFGTWFRKNEEEGYVKFKDDDWYISYADVFEKEINE